MPEEDQSGPKGWRAEVGPFLTLGIQLAAAIVVFFFVGRWLDEKFDTSPWLALLGAAVGIVGGMIKFIKSAQELGKMADREAKDAHRGGRRGE